MRRNHRRACLSGGSHCRCHLRHPSAECLEARFGCYHAHLRHGEGNREAALDLAAHANTVTKCIVDRAAGMHDTSATIDKEALVALKLTLDDVYSYLTALKKPRRRITSWILANQEKDRVARLNSALVVFVDGNCQHGARGALEHAHRRCACIHHRAHGRQSHRYPR
ncbi:hypothetical protein DFH07DRAFT_57371 [Mycena maculata]|uniref:Uncharacterized protein n=1 Tax=Mycena maculata TaxID=230809 RepID=A0AAD7IGY9_9AGAR|nr:hypothetical protein DFH07DRAFT_57371 [Mycena maculata]